MHSPAAHRGLQARPSSPFLPPATQPSKPAPLDAIQLYARARAKLVDNQRVEAIALLEKAAALDPDSFELQNDIGRAYLATSATGTASNRAMAAFEKAAAIDPDRLDVQFELGRQYLNHNDAARALDRLRTARLTSGYRTDAESDTAAMLEFFLARALKQNGYTAAALDEFAKLLKRMSRTGVSQRSGPELIYFVRHPEILYAEVGDLYEKRGEYAQALQAYELALSTDKENSDLAVRVVRAALSAGRIDDAKKRAADLVAKNHASGESVELLREIYRRVGHPEGATEALRKLHEQNPTDRLIFYALLDQLKANGRSEEAEKLLAGAARDSDANADLIRRLFALYQSRNDIEAAMRLLVDSLANRPDSLREIGPLWTELLRPARRGRLRLRTLQEMTVPPQQEAARLFWVSQLAAVWNRDALASSALRQAADLKPPFAPVQRLMVKETWAKPDLDEQQKIEACKQLANNVEREGNAALAAELRGRSMLMQTQPDAAGAAKAFATAQALGNHSPDLQLMHAVAILKQGNQARAEQLLWKLLSDWPQFEEAYSQLFELYLKERSVEQALGVLRKWLDGVPSSVDARLLQATIYAQTGDAQAMASAGNLLEDLFTEQPENLEVLRANESFYRRRGKLEEFIVKLEAERTKNPDNREGVEVLVSIYAAEKRMAEASRVLDAARAAVANDPDLLYYVAHLYERIEQKETTEQLLGEVVRMDPHHAAASNDLGYTWADEGKNLDRAESLVRVAVEQEPDNQSYLDSMAWVEYKRGKFAEARGFLDRAIGPANRPDPVVLDHLGDVLYRLNQPQDAVKQWKRSLQRIDESNLERDDLKQLRLQLMTKLKQQEQSQPVHVAPVLGGAVNSTDAKQ